MGDGITISQPASEASEYKSIIIVLRLPNPCIAKGTHLGS